MRPADADLRLKAREWEVRPVDDGVAEGLFIRHHYAAGCPKQNAYMHGLFRRDDTFWDSMCQGAALWLPPTRAVAKSLLPENPNGVLALSRLCVEPSAPGNGASFLMARSMRIIDRIRWPVFVTYADEMQGHTGAIYKATGWTYDGITQPRAAWRLNGRLVSTKNGTKSWNHAEMRSRGAELVGWYRKHRFVHRRVR